MSTRTYQNPYLPPGALTILRETTADTILDVGGGVAPHYRATHIVDFLPFDANRLTANVWGGRRTRPWQRDTYCELNLCADQRWPLDDGSIDLALCSHTIEDLPEPRFVLREIARIARAVMFIVPSRRVEHSLHLARPGYAGFRHHTWMVEVLGNRLQLTKKSDAQLVSGCHVVCPVGKRLSTASGSTFYYGPPPEVHFQTFASREAEIAENRSFVNAERRRFEWAPADEPLSIRDRFWHARARLLSRWPNGIGKRYVIPPSSPGVA